MKVFIPLILHQFNARGALKSIRQLLSKILENLEKPYSFSCSLPGSVRDFLNVIASCLLLQFGLVALQDYCTVALWSFLPPPHLWFGFLISCISYLPLSWHPLLVELIIQCFPGGAGEIIFLKLSKYIWMSEDVFDLLYCLCINSDITTLWVEHIFLEGVRMLHHCSLG